MGVRETSAQVLDRMRAKGYDKAYCNVSDQELHELQSEDGDIKLMRTAFETDVSMTGIIEHKRGSIGINTTDRGSVDDALESLRQMTNAAQPDEANDIAEHAPAAQFTSGPSEPDYDAMYDRIMELQEHVATKYPTVNLRSTSITFGKTSTSRVNSNGVDLLEEQGAYSVSVQFSAKDGEATSSMNYTGYSTHVLDVPIAQKNDVDQLIAQSVEQMHTKNIPGKFTGDLIVSPHCLSTFTGFLMGKISDSAMIDGTSIYRGQLKELVADPSLTIRCCPLSDDLTAGYHTYGTGFVAQDTTVVENGLLQTFMLSQFGANKLGMARAVNGGGCTVIEPGDSSLEDMIKDVAEGIFINRFSGGRPNDQGEFSGVAKNSYYIKDGEIQFPIRETTISGNLAVSLKNITAISRERLNSGASDVPWVQISGITAS